MEQRLTTLKGYISECILGVVFSKVGQLHRMNQHTHAVGSSLGCLGPQWALQDGPHILVCWYLDDQRCSQISAPENSMVIVCIRWTSSIQIRICLKMDWRCSYTFCECDFAVEHQFGCHTTEPGLAGDIGTIEIHWMIDWLNVITLCTTEFHCQSALNTFQGSFIFRKWSKIDFAKFIFYFCSWHK